MIGRFYHHMWDTAPPVREKTETFTPVVRETKDDKGLCANCSCWNEPDDRKLCVRCGAWLVQ